MSSRMKTGIEMLETLMNGDVPKSENRSSGDNQQGKCLSYVIGVYFGDGCVCLNYGGVKAKYFRLEVIDRDFRDYTADCCEEVFSWRAATRFETMKAGTKFYGLQVRGVGNYIESITGKRRFIPNFVYKTDENKRAFVEGLLDSEGWISMYQPKNGNSFVFSLGFAVTSEVIHELARLLSQLNVKHGKISTTTKNRKKPLKSLHINIPSFIASGLKFNIARKQERIEKFRRMREIKEERRSSREQNPGLKKRMVCSELRGDTERLAEMTSPVLQ